MSFSWSSVHRSSGWRTPPRQLPTRPTTAQKGKISGLDIAQPRANLFHIRRGKVTRAVFYWNREQALLDLGLAPQVDS
jgi:hypothetical protein